MINFRVGFGYDVHKFSRNRKLILGGIEIPSDKGLEGHSDADVLIHAICDALLGALAKTDIGQLFPDTSDEFKDMDSKIFLKKTYELLNREGYKISNIDSTIVLEKPKIAPYVRTIRETLAGILELEFDQVSVKATTSEGLGFVGREEGAASYAIALIFKP